MQLTKTKPYAHQNQAMEAAKDRVAFAYLMEQGTGKSLCLIGDIVHLWRTGKIVGAIIVAPKGCYLNWPKNELPKHMPPDVAYRVETWVAPSEQSKSLKARLNLFKDEDMPYLKIVVVNVEALTFSDTFKYLSEFLRKNRCLMAVDESTFIRTPKAKRCMYARRLGTLGAYRRILTGTPIANRPLDLYGQCVFLDPNLLGFPTFQTFKHYYADIGYFRNGQRLNPEEPGYESLIRTPGTFPVLVGYRHLDQLTKDLSEFSFRVTKKECLDLPDKIYETRYVEVTPEQKKLYNSMRDNLLAEYASGKYATATLALTQILRLQTILSGHLKGDDGNLSRIPSKRVGAWEEIVAEIPGKVITFVAHREDVKLLIEQWPDNPEKYAQYHGGNVSTREAELERWKSDPKCQYLFATSAGGVGLTLNEASTVIYYSQSYDLEKRQQSEDRCHRIGQSNKVTYYDLVVPDSVDEKILDVLRTKKNLADIVLQDIQSYVPEL